MINRELIRLKAVQITYAFYENSGKDIEIAEKELFFSLSKAYELYQHLLLLMIAIHRIAVRNVETQVARAERLRINEKVNAKFVKNLFMLQLIENTQLRKFRENMKHSWADEEEFVRRLFNKIQEADFYKEYMLKGGDNDYEEDRDLWRRIYRQILCENDDLDETLEEMSLYWNDDKNIVDSFVLKTIKKFEQANGADQPLLPEYQDDETREYASRLFRSSLQQSEEYRKLIDENAHNWDLERIATMDLIIMQLAIAEIINFPKIPIGVTITEYVDIARMYSTPRSGAYINGILDAISKKLINEHLIVKE